MMSRARFATIGDLQARLAGEGVGFGASGHASQRLTAEDLKEFLDAARGEVTVLATTTRAWMVRGTNVDGYNLVPDWLNAYQHKSYAYRGQRLEELDRFLRRMSPGDLVVTPMHGGVYIGEVTGPARFTDAAPHSNLRRDVRWFNPADRIDGNRLQAPIPALLQSQAYIVDLTEAYDQIAGLISPDTTAREPESAALEPMRRTLSFNPVGTAFAGELLMDLAELAKIAELLWERHADVQAPRRAVP